MSEMTLCGNFMCSLRHRCSRFLTDPAEHQACQTFYPEDDGTCAEFIEIHTPPAEVVR